MLNSHWFPPKNQNKEKLSELGKCKLGVCITIFVLSLVLVIVGFEASYSHGVYAAEVGAGQKGTAYSQTQPDKNLNLDTTGEALVRISQAGNIEEVAQTQVALEEEKALKEAQEEAERKKEERRIAEEKKAEEERKAKEAAEKEAAKKAAREKAAKEKAAKEKAEKERKAREAKKISLSQSDKNILLRIVEAEATSEDVKGRMLVANVILNRVKNKNFPGSVEKVVFQRVGGVYQFSPIKDGRYYSVKISSKTKTAVERVLNGEDHSNGALYFMARRKAKGSNVKWFDSHLTFLMQYGNHEFFR